MSWQPEIDEIKRRIKMAEQMGGAENIKRQHDGGKLTVRERVARLLDPGTFHEYGVLAGSVKYEGDSDGGVSRLQLRDGHRQDQRPHGRRRWR